MKKLLLALTLSLVAHAVMYLSIDTFTKPTPPERQQESKSGQGAFHIDLPIPPKPVEVELVEPKGPGPGAHQSSPDRICQNGSYEGVGIEYKMVEGKQLVTQVFGGYPAEQAGIQPGDELSGANESMAGPAGTPVTVYVKRNGAVFMKTLIREKICY